MRDATATEEDDMDKFIASAYNFWLKTPQTLDPVDLAIVFTARAMLALRALY